MSRTTPPSTAYLDHLVAETAGRRQALTRVAPAGGLGAVGGQDAALPDGGAPAALHSTIERAAERLEPELAEIVRRLHEDPETAFEEHRSAATLIEVLARHGVEAEPGAHGVPTAFRAETGDPAGPSRGTRRRARTGPGRPGRDVRDRVPSPG